MHVMSSNTLQAVQAARKTSIALAIAAAMAFTLAASVAHAHPPWDPARKTVNFSDLNLDTPEGAGVLYKRIQSAALKVCDMFGDADSIFPEARVAAERACIDDAITQAVVRVNRPLLTSLYKSKTGRTDNQLTALAQTR
jgi:UrcA family protein